MNAAKPIPPNEKKPTASDLQRALLRHLQYTLVKDDYFATKSDTYLALAHAVRDMLVDRWLDTQQSYYLNDSKRVYYISMEFLVGRTLGNSLINMEIMDQWETALKEMGLDVRELQESEWDAGLGNGGLGRLAACFLDSMATMSLPAYGYGIRYEYGMFFQKIEDGAQQEVPDNWLRYGNPWEFGRPEHLHKIRYQGRVTEYAGEHGELLYSWVDTSDVMAMAYDVPVPGYGNQTVNTMRLWSAKSTRDFEFSSFNQGNYVGAVESKMRTENISKVLYPADHMAEGRELRLRQEYFLSSATVQDIFYRFAKKHSDLGLLPEKVAIQLNDTHPALAIPELLRILLDEKMLSWESAWGIARLTFAYTNHTVLPEALEKWPVRMLENILPRHLMIIYQINAHFLGEVEFRFPGDSARIKRMSIVGEEGEKHIRMAHLAIVGSHSVNGVSALHSDILKNELFRDFHELWPERFNNKTNGITQRRWLKHANRWLADLISSRIGDGWVTCLDELKKLRELADDLDFRKQWQEVKLANKRRLAEQIHSLCGVIVSPDSMFDCQTKRIHEYKRQLLNLLHVVTRYNRIKTNPGDTLTPRTVIFSGKAAPSYFMAKLIIQLINSVGAVINNDPDINGLLKLVYLPNYNVSLAEIIFPAADLSEQISTAGTEASGTGNMKYALNGALTIGTLDGANIEIMEEIGRDNIFIFGMSASQVTGLKNAGYLPHDYYQSNPELKQAIDMIAGGAFSPGNPNLFKPLTDALLKSDPYLLLADYASYVSCQDEVDKLYRQPGERTRRSILNTAGMGKFSSDRTIAEYAREIWGVRPVNVCRRNGGIWPEINKGTHMNTPGLWDSIQTDGKAAEAAAKAPLAERMRPRCVAEFCGQEHLLGPGRILQSMIESDNLCSLIFWGPPGCGKTTLAHLIARETKSHFIFFSAILSGIKEIRETFREAEGYAARGQRTILFVDEIHRFNKSQQDAFLPYVEKGVVTIIGATTENPSFEVIAPLLSRCRVLTLNQLEPANLRNIMENALADRERELGRLGLGADNEALGFLAEQAGGDARIALNTLEVAAGLMGKKQGEARRITLEIAQEALQKKALLYDKGGEEHYNVISAFIKSMRASDPDAALYWLARMLEAGEDPIFILRRMIILASEDIGNADPRAFQIAVAALQAFQVIGMPEGRIILSQAVAYLATAPKSNASYVGIDSALAEVRKSGALPVPLHVRNAPTRLMKDLGYGKGYQYAHDYQDGYAGQECLPERLAGSRFYEPKGYGYEKSIVERMEWLKRKREGDGKDE